MSKNLKQAIQRSGKALYKMLPIMVGIILLIGLVNTIIPKKALTYLFSKNIFLDSFVGGALGSIMAGNPVTSYILGGEFLDQGISLIAVTAFIVAWVTVGMVQLPAESMILGKRFAIIRNALSFVFSIIVALVAVFVLGII